MTAKPTGPLGTFATRPGASVFSCARHAGESKRVQKILRFVLETSRAMTGRLDFSTGLDLDALWVSRRPDRGLLHPRVLKRTHQPARGEETQSWCGRRAQRAGWRHFSRSRHPVRRANRSDSRETFEERQRCSASSRSGPGDEMGPRSRHDGDRSGRRQGSCFRPPITPRRSDRASGSPRPRRRAAARSWIVLLSRPAARNGPRRGRNSNPADLDAVDQHDDLLIGLEHLFPAIAGRYGVRVDLELAGDQVDDPVG